MIPIRSFILVISIIAIAFGVGMIVMNYLASTIDHNTEQAWQRNFREALLEGYTNFKGQYVNADIAAYIFSYDYPLSSAKNAEEALEKLKMQLPSEFYVYSESSDQLVLRQPVAYSGPGGFNEYRFMIDSNLRKVTVLFANLDSSVEREQHEQLIARQRSIHEKEK